MHPGKLKRLIDYNFNIPKILINSIKRRKWWTMHITKECRNYVILNYTEHESREMDWGNRTNNSKEYCTRKTTTNGGIVNIIRVDGIQRLPATNFNFKSVWGSQSILKISVQGHGTEGTYAIMGGNPDQTDRPFTQVAKDIGYVYEKAVGYHTIVKPKVKISMVVCHAARPRNWVIPSPNHSLENRRPNRGPSFLTYLASAVSRFIPTFSIKGYFTACSFDTPTDPNLRSKIQSDTIIDQHNRRNYKALRYEIYSIRSNHPFAKFCLEQGKSNLVDIIVQTVDLIFGIPDIDNTLNNTINNLGSNLVKEAKLIRENEAGIDSLRKALLKQHNILKGHSGNHEQLKLHLAHKLAYYNGLLVSDNYTSVINSTWGKQKKPHKI